MAGPVPFPTVRSTGLGTRENPDPSYRAMKTPSGFRAVLSRHGLGVGTTSESHGPFVAWIADQAAPTYRGPTWFVCNSPIDEDQHCPWSSGLHPAFEA